MITLVSGGAGSGKSAFAEDLALGMSGEMRVYLATMEVWGEEDRQRVERHRAMRRTKGFFTVECPKHLEDASVPAGSVVLLEDLSNLTANECFGGAGSSGALQRILAGIASVEQRASQVIIVTNELFSDGVAYPQETARYLALLAELNCRLAEQAAQVVEVVAGIPVYWKRSME